MSLLFEFISTFIVSLSEVIAWKNIVSNCEIKKYKYYFFPLILTVLNMINYHFMSDFIKAVGIIAIAIIICRLMLNISIKRAIIVTFICEMLVIISEAIFALFLALIFKMELESKSIMIAYILDFSIAIFLYTISKVNIIHKTFIFIDEITAQIKLYQVILFLVFVMLSSSSIFAYVYLDKNIPLILIINVFICIIYTAIVILVFNYQNRYYKANFKYQNSIDNLQAQELIIDDYRIMNHENKNQLLTIKSMSSEKVIINYINSLVKQKEQFKSEIIDVSLRLPQGGIRGLIYTKLLYMKDKKIKCNLHVDKKIKEKFFSNMNDNDVVDICQILGVYIDNAIEEVLDLKEKIVTIDLYIDHNNLNISISNKYGSELKKNKDNNSDLSTTKGNGRGYGLKLVKRLLSNNKKLSNKTQITKDTFNQILCIKL